MLDITTITRQNVTSVVGYYSDAKDDYYSKDSSFTSWQGTGAEALGLSGDVESARFKELLVGEIDTFTGTVAKLAMRQPFVLFKGLTFQKLCLPGAFRPGDHHNKMLRPGLCVVHASPQYL